MMHCWKTMANDACKEKPKETKPRRTTDKPRLKALSTTTAWEHFREHGDTLPSKKFLGLQAVGSEEPFRREDSQARSISRCARLNMHGTTTKPYLGR